MNLEKIWQYRAYFYVALMMGAIVYNIKDHVVSHREETPDEKFLRNYRSLNASFWPPDIVPHPNLPHPDYPSPGTEDEINA